MDIPGQVQSFNGLVTSPAALYTHTHTHIHKPPPQPPPRQRKPPTLNFDCGWKNRGNIASLFPGQKSEFYFVSGVPWKSVGKKIDPYGVRDPG